MARSQVAAAVTARGFGRREVIVRVNGLDTAWWLDDIGMAAEARPDGFWFRRSRACATSPRSLIASAISAPTMQSASGS